MNPRNLYRLLKLGALLFALYALVKFTPIGEYFTLENLQQVINDAGIWGVLLFGGLFIVGILLNIPGFLMLVAWFLVYNSVLGWLSGLVFCIIAVAVHFWVIRKFTGRVLREVKQPFLKKMLARIEAKPIQTTFILRLLMFISPPVNYALVLSPISFRQFIIGSAIGLPFPLTTLFLMVKFSQDTVLQWLG